MTDPVEFADPLVHAALCPPAHDYASTAAPVSWFGGKGRMIDRLGPLVPHGNVYVEPYGGAASLMFARRAAPVEVYNDLNGHLVNLFRALQCPRRFARLTRRLQSTPYAREEFRDALTVLADAQADKDERAWAFFVAQNQGFGGKASTVGDWGRDFTTNKGMATTCKQWSARVNALPRWHARMMRVQIDSRDALKVIDYWDSPETVFYLDPPYAADARTGTGKDYLHETDDEHHGELVDRLLALEGRAVLSGYDTPLYERLGAAGWEQLRFDVASYAAGRVRGSKLRGKGAATAHAPRTECVWRSPGCQVQGDLFGLVS